MTCYRSAYTVDEKAVFKIVATATVFETFTYQVSAGAVTPYGVAEDFMALSEKSWVFY